MNVDSLQMLIIVLVAIVAMLIGALSVFIYQRSKGGIASKNEDDEYKRQVEEKRKAELKEAQSAKIRDFMEFDKVEDDMIVQNDGTRFVMAIRCMGINYDLMSEAEMLSVEEGFTNFLNTLRFPVQLYVQARSLDLSEGLRTYHARLEELKADADKFIEAADKAKANPTLTTSQRQQLDYEARKKKNLIDYGTDILGNVERMSLNKNILQKKYYIIVSYETAEMGMTNNFTKEEARDIAYSELYTRCKSIQAVIASCGIESNILSSEDLAELLYIAYNKDDADIYNIRKGIDSGVYRLFSTSQDIREKKREALDAKIKEEAMAQAEMALKIADESINRGRVDIGALTEQEEYEDATKKEAINIIADNAEYLDPEVAVKAMEDLNSSMHRPAASEEDLKAIEEEVNAQLDAQFDINNGDTQNFTQNDTSINSVQDIDKLLSGNIMDN